MNTVCLIGNLTRDVEVRYTTGAEPKAIAKFSIAVNDGFGDNAKVSYPNVVVFGKQAETCERFLTKGSKVAIKGRLQTGSYEKDGRTIYTTDVIADNYGGVEFLSSNESRGADKTAQNENLGVAGGGFSALTDDDVPF